MRSLIPSPGHGSLTRRQPWPPATQPASKTSANPPIGAVWEGNAIELIGAHNRVICEGEPKLAHVRGSCLPSWEIRGQLRLPLATLPTTGSRSPTRSKGPGWMTRFGHSGHRISDFRAGPQPELERHTGLETIQEDSP